MNKLFYPAIFHKDEENGFWVSFPDFPECLTEGDDMEKAYEMAVDALGLAYLAMVLEFKKLTGVMQEFETASEIKLMANTHLTGPNAFSAHNARKQVPQEVKEFFDNRSGKCNDGIYPTVTIRQIMWALKMKPIKRERWETCFDRRII